MPNTIQDDALDPLEQVDMEEEVEEIDDDLVVNEDDAPHPELPPEIQQEIERALLPPDEDEEVNQPATLVKKPHMLPEDLIKRPLTADDLFDEGSI